MDGWLCGRFATKNLTIDVSWSHASPEEVTAEEKRLIMEGSLGYCEAHCVLYRKSSDHDLKEHGMSFGIPQCFVWVIACKCDDPACTSELKLADVGPCKEWGQTSLMR